MTTNAHARFVTLSLILVGALAATSCSSSGNGTVDSRAIDGSGAHDAAATGDAAGSACTSYTTSTIAGMRGATPGCYELDGVVSIALTPSTKSPTIYVQDTGGGAFSAMQTKCSTGSTSHPCSMATAATVAGIANGTSVTIKGTYIKTASTHFEEFFIDSITAGASATAPAAGSATLADIERSGSDYGLAFQRVTVTIGTPDTLKMYDFSPAEFTDSTATSCEYVEGFGMIPTSTTGVTDGSACAGSAAQPSGQTSPNATEVLFGTDFYKGFVVSTDCRCAEATDKVPVAGSTLVGAVSGILVYDVAFGATTGYFYLDPQTSNDAPISGTVAGTAL